MRILVTGSKGFIARNLIVELKNRGYTNILEFDKSSSREQLNSFCLDCDYVYHLAGVNRPEKAEDYMVGNLDFTEEMLNALKNNLNNPPIAITSSIQATLDNPYGKSKNAAEQAIISNGLENNRKVIIYRLPNVFGKWCKPNYNSVIATFCYNLANNLPITINDPTTKLNLAYIDDVIDTLIYDMENYKNINEVFRNVTTSYSFTLGSIVELLQNFKESRINKYLPNTEDSFEKKLYSTYLTYLPTDKFLYPLLMNKDERGSFTEMLKSKERGQFSVNITKPGITKGNHWHHTKNEKFIVLSGTGIIRFRKIGESEIFNYIVSGNKIEVVDIPPGYTHNITNIDNVDLITFMWCNECFDKKHPDTFYEEV